MSESSLSHLKAPADFMSVAQHLFPSEASLGWFIRSHRSRLEAAGALVVLNRRVFLDVPVFEREVFRIGRDAVAEAV